MKALRRLFVIGVGLAMTASASAGLVDRFESGRMVTKGWRPNAWPSSRMTVRSVASPMLVSTGSGRVAYSSAFQAPQGDTAVTVIVPTTRVEMVQPSSRGLNSMPTSIRRSYKGTYRNSR